MRFLYTSAAVIKTRSWPTMTFLGPKTKAVAQLSLLLSLALIHVATVWASSFQVSPIQVFLSAKSSSALLSLRNQSNESLRFQLTVYGWDQGPQGEDLFRSTDDIVFFPALVTLAPGEERKIRIGAPAARTAVEKSYRIFVEELPAQRREDAREQGQVRLLTKLGVPIFLQPEKVAAEGRIEEMAVRKGVLSFQLKNTGNVHVVPQQIMVKGYGSTGEALFERQLASWYLLAGGLRVYKLELPKEHCVKTKALSVDVQQGQKSLQGRIDVRPESCKQ